MAHRLLFATPTKNKLVPGRSGVDHYFLSVDVMNLAPFPTELVAEAATGMQEPGLALPWQERRDCFRARLEEIPLPGIEPEETAAHFDGMPPHYWKTLNFPDLVWSLETINGFLKLVAAPNVPATTPFMDWRQLGKSGHTRLMLCTWDRHGLLAKASAALSAVRLNILEADVFTRHDNVVLDVFLITDADGKGPANQKRLAEMKFLIEGALSEPPRFASLWACSRHKYLAAAGKFPLRISFDNNSDSSDTLVRIETSDRLGLLYDILQAMADSGLNITEARIETVDGLADDLFHVTDEHGQKVGELVRLEELRQNLEKVLSFKA